MFTIILRLRQVVLHPLLLPTDYQVSAAETQVVYVCAALGLGICLTKPSRCIMCTEGVSEEDGLISTCKHLFCARW